MTRRNNFGILNGGSALERSALVAERTVRDFRTRLYDAIVAAAKNAELLSAKDPVDIRIEECEGTQWSKNSMIRVCNWLNAIRAVSASDSIFESQVLDPVRTSTQCLSSIRRLSKPTADMDGYVFGMSRPYRYEHYDADRITAFVVMPELESVMSVRFDASDPDRVSTGFYRMGGVQPIPLVNRLHQPRPTFAKIHRRPDLASWDFLKIGFGDQCSLSSSAEMEGFLEVDSAQSDQRHHLGAAFILACKIAAVHEPNIIVQRVRGEDTATMALSEGLSTSEDRGDFGLSDGKYARVLAVQWYGADGEGAEKLPEIFMIEPAISERDALKDEITGRVRMRGSVPIEELESMCGRADLSETKALSVTEGTVSYVHKHSAADPVADAFLRSSTQLRGLRTSFRTDLSLRAEWRDVLDEGKVSAKGLANLLKSHPRHQDILVDIQMHIDSTGEAATYDEIADSLGLEPGRVKQLLGWLKYLGLVERKDGRIWSTGTTRHVLAEAFYDHVGKIEAASDVLSVPELEASVPQSVVMALLSRSDGGFVPLRDGGRANRLYWVRKGTDGSVALAAEKKLQELYRGVLGIMRSVSFPVTAKYVAQEAKNTGLPISHLVANAVAESLVRAGKLLPSGESWEYPIIERMADFLSENAAGEFTVDEIVSGARIAGRDRALAAEALRSLAEGGRATEMSDGVWSCRSSEEQVRSHYKEKIKSKALALIRARKNGMDKNVLFGYLRKFVLDIDSERRLPNPRNSIIDAVAELEDKGLIVSADGMCRIRT